MTLNDNKFHLIIALYWLKLGAIFNHYSVFVFVFCGESSSMEVIVYGFVEKKKEKRHRLVR